MKTKTSYRGRNSQKRTWTYSEEPQTLPQLRPHTSQKIASPKIPKKQLSPRQAKSLKLDKAESDVPSSPRGGKLPLTSSQHELQWTPYRKKSANFKTPYNESRTENSISSEGLSVEDSKTNNDPTLSEILKSIQRLEYNQKMMMETLSQQSEKVEILYRLVSTLLSGAKGGAVTEDEMDQNGEDKGERGSRIVSTKSQRLRMKLNLVKSPGSVKEEENI